MRLLEKGDFPLRKEVPRVRKVGENFKGYLHEVTGESFRGFIDDLTSVCMEQAFPLDLTRVTCFVRGNRSGLVVVARYTIDGVSSAVTVPITLPDGYGRVQVDGQDKWMNEVEAVLVLCRLLVGRLRRSVIEYFNKRILNEWLILYKPTGSPYTVQFEVSESRNAKAVSKLSETEITWVVVQSYFVNRLIRSMEEGLRSYGSLPEVIRHYFYGGVNVLDLFSQSQGYSHYGYLTTPYPVKSTFNPRLVLRSLGKKLDTSKAQHAPFLYEEVGNVLTLHGRVSDAKMVVYQEVLKVNLTNGDLLDCDTSYNYVASTREGGLLKLTS